MPKSIPVLDMFVLAALDLRGGQSQYDLQKHFGLSLGASTPSLHRLMRIPRMVEQFVGRTNGNRLRYEYRLTPRGKKQASSGWRELCAGEPPAEIETLLRIINMAIQYATPISEVAGFATRAAETRMSRSSEAREEANRLARNSDLLYLWLRAECESARLQAESLVLKRLASKLLKPKSRSKNAKFRQAAAQTAMLPGLG